MCLIWALSTNKQINKQGELSAIHPQLTSHYIIGPAHNGPNNNCERVARAGLISLSSSHAQAAATGRPVVTFRWHTRQHCRPWNEVGAALFPVYQLLVGCFARSSVSLLVKVFKGIVHDVFTVWMCLIWALSANKQINKHYQIYGTQQQRPDSPSITAPGMQVTQGTQLPPRRHSQTNKQSFSKLKRSVCEWFVLLSVIQYRHALDCNFLPLQSRLQNDPLRRRKEKRHLRTYPTCQGKIT